MSAEEIASFWAFRKVDLQCHITDRKVSGSQLLYRVRYRSEYYDEDGIPNQNDSQESDWIVREAISMADPPYSMDLHLQCAFRHPLVLPDVPDARRGHDCQEHAGNEANECKSDASGFDNSTMA